MRSRSGYYFVCSAALLLAGLVGCGGKGRSPSCPIWWPCAAAAIPPPRPRTPERPRIRSSLSGPTARSRTCWRTRDWPGSGRPGTLRTRQPSSWWRAPKVTAAARTRACCARIPPGGQRRCGLRTTPSRSMRRVPIPRSAKPTLRPATPVPYQHRSTGKTHWCMRRHHLGSTSTYSHPS